MSVVYIHLPRDAELPAVEVLKPFKAVVVVCQEVTDVWRNRVSDWLVREGCLYMMAWGIDCSAWDDSVDWASLASRDYEPASDELLVMTTWHEDEPLSETFWFAEHAARHPVWPLSSVVILDIVSEDREAEILTAYQAAQIEPAPVDHP